MRPLVMPFLGSLGLETSYHSDFSRLGRLGRLVIFRYLIYPICDDSTDLHSTAQAGAATRLDLLAYFLFT